MTTPDGINLNSALGYGDIAAALGLDLHDDRGLWSACPLCRGGPLRICRDPDTQGWWWACGDCGWAGDSLSLYQATRDMPDARTAWLHLRRDLELDARLPACLLTEEVIDRHVSENQRRAAVMAFVKRSVRIMAIDQPSPAVAWLNNIGAWGGYTSHNYATSMGRYVGGATRAVINTARRKIGLLGAVPSVGFRASAITCYESLPGKPATLLLNTPTRPAVALAVPWNTLTREPGILGLSRAMTAPLVYAVSRQNLFLNIQRTWGLDHHYDLPMVCYPGRTEPAFGGLKARCGWDALAADRVIFWDYGREPEVIDAARSLGDRGLVAVKPDLLDYEEGSSPLIGRSIEGLLAEWEQSAVPWHKAVIDWLLESSPADAQRFMGGMSPLSAAELRLLRETCGETRWTTLKTLFERPTSVKLFSLDNHRFAVRPGLGIFELVSNPRPGRPVEAMVCSAFMELSEASEREGEVLLAGHVCSGRDQVPFTTTDAALVKGTAELLTSLCVRNELPIPHISPKWRKSLYSLFKAMHPPESVRVPERSGWDPFGRSFVLPGFTVDAGGLRMMSELSGLTRQLPGHGIPPALGLPGAQRVAQWLKPGNAHARGCWAVLLAVLHNLSSPAVAGRSQAGILLTGDPVIADGVLAWAAGAFGLATVNAGKIPTPGKIHQIVSLERGHDLPVVVDGLELSNKSWGDWHRFNHPRNCLLRATRKQAVDLSLSGRWLWVDVDRPGVDAGGDAEGIEALVALFLTDLTAGGLTPLGGGGVGAIASLLRSRMAPLSGNDFPSAVECAAEGMVVTPDHLWEAFLWLVFWCMEHEGLVMADPPAPGSRPALCLGDKGVRLRWPALSSFCSDKGFHPPDPDALDDAATAATATVIQEKDGWTLPIGVWEAALLHWRGLWWQST